MAQYFDIYFKKYQNFTVVNAFICIQLFVVIYLLKTTAKKVENILVINQ